MSPLGKLDFGNKLRMHQLNLSQSANLAIKRILLRLKRLQATEHFLEHLLIKPRAHLPNVNQPFLRII